MFFSKNSNFANSIFLQFNVRDLSSINSVRSNSLGFINIKCLHQMVAKMKELENLSFGKNFFFGGVSLIIVIIIKNYTAYKDN